MRTVAAPQTTFSHTALPLNESGVAFELASEARHRAGLLILECGFIALSLARGVARVLPCGGGKG